MIGQGLSNREIAADPGLAVPTGETHRQANAHQPGRSGRDPLLHAAALGTGPPWAGAPNRPQ